MARPDHHASLDPRRFRDLLEASHDVVFATDGGGRLTFVGGAARAVLGREPVHLLGRRATELEAPAARGQARRRLADIRAGAPGLSFETVVLRPDGGETALQVDVVVHRDEEGRVTGTTGAAKDIGDRRRAEDAQREGELRLRELAESVHEVFWSWSLRERRIEYVSPAYAEIWGRPADSVYDDPSAWLAAVHPADRGRVGTLLEPGHLDVRELEYRVVRPGGDVRWVWSRAFTVRDEHGLPVRLIGVGDDVTERRTIEARLARRAAQQAAVARMGRQALRGVGLGELIDGVVKALADELDVELAALLEFLADGPALHCRTVLGGPDAEAALAAPVVLDEAGWTALRSGPFVITGPGDPAVGLVPVAAGLGVESVISVVIPGQPEPFGVLAAASRTACAFSEEDIAFAESLANVVGDAIERQRVEDDARHQALHDLLTGLPNRALFLDRLEHALATGRERHASCAVLFVDLDHFKLVNDAEGHVAGDELLTAVAWRLRRAVGSTDTVARFGGDEFGILLEDIAGEHDAVRVAERLLAGLIHPFVLEGGQHFVTASIGIAIPTGPRADPKALIRDSDTAMYRAKDRGRGRFELFDGAMRARAVDRLRTESDLRRALEQGELRLLYQPIVALASGDIVAVEALLRWQHPEQGLRRALDFIPVAEDSRLITPVGAWVLERAWRDAAAWHGERPDERPLGIAVNLSARQVAHGNLPDVLARDLAELQIDPTVISLEITERVLLEQRDSGNETLRRMKDLGVRIVLDDFGTGSSPLGYLKRAPIDAVKVHGSFVAGLGTSSEDTAIVEAVVGMADALGLEVVAEGVETATQVAHLRRLGCPYAQGYHFSDAVAAPGVHALLGARSPFADRVGRLTPRSNPA